MMTQPNFSADIGMDEALWAAYHRSDKTAVTKELFYRFLARVDRWRPSRQTSVLLRGVRKGRAEIVS